MKQYLLLFLLITVLVIVKFEEATGQVSPKNSKPKGALPATAPLVTFVELGSVNCIPCKAMQPVMKSIEEKYGSQIKVIFYDVWKSDQQHFARQYRIRVIPTQVFLDKNGKEFHRHEGFYPEKEIVKLLAKQGLKIQSGE